MVLSVLLSIIAPILLFAYARQLQKYSRAFVSIDTYHTDLTEMPSVSIIIPARNEEKNIERCLDSLMLLNFPKEKLEVIVVDDESTDNTAALVSSYPVTLIRNQASAGTIVSQFKKDKLPLKISVICINMITIPAM